MLIREISLHIGVSFEIRPIDGMLISSDSWGYDRTNSERSEVCGGVCTSDSRASRRERPYAFHRISVVSEIAHALPAWLSRRVESARLQGFRRGGPPALSWKKSGREWKGLSPFQQEKTPSFFVNDQKQAWFDFSSGKNGNIFDFVTETEGVSFPEAVERLASLAGLPLPRTSREEEQREERQKSLYDVMELATKYFEQNLASNIGAQARGYLSDRAIAPSTGLEFRLGYATPNRFGLKEYLGSKGVSVEDMIETGLLIAGDDIPLPYDRFRDPHHCPVSMIQRGRVIATAFGGRESASKSDVQPKYLNSPETSIFHKGSVVFNFHRAREPAHRAGSVVAVEGYMDAIAIYQAGIKSVVATMGTAFTEEQIITLWRLSSEPVICFDADRAGIAAAHRSIDRILPVLTVGKSFRFVFMLEEKDPDDLIRERGVEAFKSLLVGSLPHSGTYCGPGNRRR